MRARLGFFLLASLVLSCSAPSEDPNQEKGSTTVDPTVRIHLSRAPASLTLLGKADTRTEAIAFQISDPLVQYTPDLKLEGRIAESWTISPDNTEITFTLREGVKWHDGQPVTADDVLFTSELLAKASTENRSHFGEMSKLVTREKIDDRTVKFATAEPRPDLAELFRFSLVPKHLLENEADIFASEFATHPVGCGAFRFVRYEQDQELVLEANEEYWEGRPNIDRLIFKMYPDDRTALQATLQGEIDVMTATPDLWMDAHESDRISNLNAMTMPTMRVWIAMWNQNQVEFFNDVRVRKALIHALNREEFTSKVAMDLALPGATPYSALADWRAPNVSPTAYSPAQAAALLTEAGWVDRDGDGIRERDGVPLAFTYTYPASSQRITDLMAAWQKEEWRKAGFDVTLERMEWAAMRAKRNAKEYDSAAFSITLSSPDIRDLIHSDAQTGGWNTFGLSDPDVDRLTTEGLSESDPDKRKQIYYELQERLVDLEAVSALFYFTSPVLANRRVEGIASSPIGILSTTAGPRAWRVTS